MPTYSSTNPPLALFPGDIGFSFSNEAPAGGTAGAQFALPSPAGFPDQGRTVRWQTIFASAPTSISLSLQAAMSDVDAEYSTLDTSTATAGEARTVSNVRANFLRIKCNSASGGSGYTAKLLA
jgi:hypothetical protein